MTENNGLEKFVELFKRYENDDKDYSFPRLTDIAGIPTVIVDPHNEVLPFWYFKDASATVVHFDKHPDTIEGNPTLESLENEKRMSIVDYTINYHQHSSFVSTAIFYEVISDFYYVDLRIKKVTKLRSRNKSQKSLRSLVKEDNGFIVWNHELLSRSPPAINMSVKQMISEINRSSNPLVVDTDLDVIESRGDIAYLMKNLFTLGHYGSSTRPWFLESRYRRFESILRPLRKPDRITIAKSLTPICYTPRNHADYHERRILDILEDVYSGNRPIITA
jgi:hypothetical protein